MRVARDGNGPFLQVEDQGHGIPDDQLSRIFEPFFTTRATGTGLGLAVVRRFAESHGGTIDVSTAPDEGSVFTIRLRDDRDPPEDRRSGRTSTHTKYAKMCE